MSILMFSANSFICFQEKILKSLYLCKYEQKLFDIAVKLRLTWFWLIFFFVILLGWFPYGDIWADVELSSLWMFCKT